MNAVPTCSLHKGRRDKQEDQVAFSAFDNEGFVTHAGIAAVVADGIGGVQYGYESAKAAVQAFLSSYHQKTPDESIPLALDRSFKAANMAVRGLGAQMGEERSVGTTLTAAVLWQDQLHWISAGDSAVLRCADGQVQRCTASHEIGATGSIDSFLGLPPDELRIDREPAPVKLQPNDVVIVCSDGLYKWLSDAAIAKVCRSSPAVELADQLLTTTLSLDQETQDNIAVAALVYTGSKSTTGVVGTGGTRGRRRKLVLSIVALAVAAAAAAGGAYYWFVLRPLETRRAEARQLITQVEQSYAQADCTKVAEIGPKIDRTLGIDTKPVDTAVQACRNVAEAVKNASARIAEADGLVQKVQAPGRRTDDAKLAAEASAKYQEALKILTEARTLLPKSPPDLTKLEADVRAKQSKLTTPAAAPAARSTRPASKTPPSPPRPIAKPPK